MVGDELMCNDSPIVQTAKRLSPCLYGQCVFIPHLKHMCDKLSVEMSNNAAK